MLFCSYFGHGFSVSISIIIFRIILARFSRKVEERFVFFEVDDLSGNPSVIVTNFGGEMFVRRLFQQHQQMPTTSALSTAAMEEIPTKRKYIYFGNVRFSYLL